MDEATRKRMRAGRLMLAGKTPAEAAKLVGVARQTAYTWKARLDEGGIDALRSMATGRPTQLEASNSMHCVPRCSKAPWPTSSAPSCGRSSACEPSSNGCTACTSAKCMSGACSGPWASARRSLSAVPSSATSRRCWRGNARPGLRSKKVCLRAATDRLHRRVGPVGAAHSSADLGAQRLHADRAVPLQLEARLGLTRANFLFRLYDGAIRSAQIVEFLKALRAQPSESC